MNLEFTFAKNGEKTVKANSIFIHSTYAPSTEAQRFVSSLVIPYSPCAIILIEPGLNYLLNSLKEKYKNIKFGVIRYSDEFCQFDNSYDFSINAISENVEQKLYENLTEEELCSTYFLSWTPTAKVFSELDKIVWQQIKKCLEQSKTILISREYFEKKWLENCCKNLLNLKQNFTLNKKIDLPVFVVASGPSLLSKIDFIKVNQNKAFIICLSSAISVLLKNEIIPDLCFTTDGGYWAGEHLKELSKHKLNLAIAAEAFCPGKLYKSCNIVLLNYPDGLSNEIVKSCGINSIFASRNGTVSGTALDFCLSNSTNSIYFFGLDLSASKGFQHANPNELEKNNSLNEIRINTREKRMTSSICHSDSLLIYENWFKNKQTAGKKVFRVIEKNEANNNLNEIKDICLKDISKTFKDLPDSNKSFYNYFCKIQVKISKSQLYSFIFNKLSDEKYLKTLFPLDFVALSHNTSDNEIIKNRISEKTEKIKYKLEKIFDGNK